MNEEEKIDEILISLCKQTTLADRAAELATTASGVKDASNRFEWSVGEAKATIEKLKLKGGKNDGEANGNKALYK